MTVTFVCVGNTCRSPLLKALFTSYAEQCGFEVTVESAGLSVTDGKISEFTKNILLEHSISVENENTTTFTSSLGERSDLIVAVDDYVADKVSQFHCSSKVFSLSSPLLIGENMIDPYGNGPEAYSQIFEQGVKALPKIMSLCEILR